MKYKPIKQYIAFILLAVVLSMTTINAATTTLFRITGNTFATSQHDDGFFADTYYGTVSVRGADRFIIGPSMYYPTWCRITYDVQGEISSKQVDSYGKDNQSTYKSSITVQDPWNIGSKTKVFGNYGTGYVNNAQITSLDASK